MTSDCIIPNRKMTPEERSRAFHQVYEQIPDEPRGQRVRTVSEILMCDDNTVRIWSLNNTQKPIPQEKLRLLVFELEKRGIVVPAADTA